MLALLAPLLFAQDSGATAPFDEVYVLELTADDPAMIDGRGPTAVVELELGFSGTLHLWTRSELDLYLRVVDPTDGGVLAEDDDAGGGDVPYVRGVVEEGDRLAVLIASSSADAVGPLELHVVAAPETAATREAARIAEEGLAEGRRLQQEGDPGAVRSLLDELVSTLLSTPGSERSEKVAEACWQLGLLALETSDPDSARATFGTTRDHRERTLPPDHADLIEAKRSLAATLYELRELERAHALFVAVHTALERLLAEGHPDLLDAKWSLAATSFELGDVEGARALHEAVYEVWRRTLPPEHPDLLAAKQNLALTSRALGDLAGAHARFEELLAAWRRILPEGDPVLLGAKENLAAARYELGSLDGARALFEELLAERERLLPGDHPDLLRTRVNLSNVLFELGDLTGALALLEAVRAVQQRSLPPDHPDLLRVELNLAGTRHALGDVAGALALFQSVYAVWERQLPAGHLDLVAAKHNLAASLLELGDVEGAHALTSALHAELDGVLPPDHPALLDVKLNLASTLFELGERDRAAELQESVLAARERLLPADHPELLAAELALAHTLRALGDLARAAALGEAVVAAREQLLPVDHPDLLGAQLDLALTRLESGNAASAEVLAAAVQSARTRLLPAHHPDLLRAIGCRALARAAQDDLAGARDLGEDIAAALGELAAGALVAAPRDARQAGAHALALLAAARQWGPSARGTLERASFEVLETVRLAATAPLAALAMRSRGELADGARARLRAAESELDGLVAAGPEELDEAEGEPDPLGAAEAGRAWREAIQAAALRRDAAQRELLSLLEGKLVVRITADAVSAALRRDQVAVAITKLAHLRWDDVAGRTVDSGPYYLAQVLRPGGELREVDLGPADALEERIDAWRRALGAPIERGLAGGGDSGRTELETGRALRASLVDPLLAAAGNPEPGVALHVCLDDALFTVPLDALPLDEAPASAGAARSGRDEGDVARLGDRYRVRGELSLAGLLRREPAPDATPSVLVVGDVDFDGRPKGDVLADAKPLYRLSAWASWDRLSATRAELLELAEQAERELGIAARVLRGGQVTQEALEAAVRGARHVHLATHGFFIPRSERKSLLDDGPTAVGRLDDELLGNRETVTGFAPLTLCGLVLSGANAGETDAERSACLLTAEELSGFDLSACDLAVLSACETNVGITRAGQGIQSLQTALHMAGARTSVTSLWAVRDWPTQELMKQFYDNLWAKKMPKAEALWQAKCALRRAGEPPYSWAGWVMAGDPD